MCFEIYLLIFTKHYSIFFILHSSSPLIKFRGIRSRNRAPHEMGLKPQIPVPPILQFNDWLMAYAAQQKKPCYRRENCAMPL